jgi:cell wall-associated NlpC family hydrolase
MWHQQYIGIPFAEKGRDATGLDCWGLVKLVYEKELGVELPGYEWAYHTTQDKDAIGNEIAMERVAGWREVETPAPFDLVILRMQGVPMHVGVVTSAPSMIHSARGVNVALERYDSMRWKNRVNGYVRHASR